MIVKNSSGIIMGEIEFQENTIMIKHVSKPILIINSIEDINYILNKDKDFIVILYDEYYLTIGEIATLYGVPYSNMNKQMNLLDIKTKAQSGRRNSSFGKQFSQERKDNISHSLQGKKCTTPPYERTPEIKQKISDGLKRYFQEHEVSEETRLKLSAAWTRGCYDRSKMGRGIQGYIFSIKMKRDFYFRSLLELKYLLQIETDDDVINYQVEPFQIKLGDNHHYTPDILINNTLLIELKPFTHLNYESEERFNLEMSCAKQYCIEHNYIFKIVYDRDIEFRTSTFKTWIQNNPLIVELYNIRFNYNWLLK